MKGKLSAVLFILVFILVAAAVFTILNGLERSTSQTSQPEPTNAVTIVTEAPATPLVLPSQAPVPTVVVNATPAPSPTPLPTTVPTTAPLQTTLASGSFSSDTGTWLNITADWSAKSISQEQVQVTVSVAVVSYALHTQALPRTLNISLDGQYVSLDAPAITYDGEPQIANGLGTHTFTVNLPANSSKAMSLQVEWQFNGSYGGPNGPIELYGIECGGTINVAR